MMNNNGDREQPFVSHPYQFHMLLNNHLHGRWKEYIENLYDKDNKPKQDDILQEEVEEAALGQG